MNLREGFINGRRVDRETAFGIGLSLHHIREFVCGIGESVQHMVGNDEKRSQGKHNERNHGAMTKSPNRCDNYVHHRAGAGSRQPDHSTRHQNEPNEQPRFGAFFATLFEPRPLVARVQSHREEQNTNAQYDCGARESRINASHAQPQAT